MDQRQTKADSSDNSPTEHKESMTFKQGRALIRCSCGVQSRWVKFPEELEVAREELKKAHPVVQSS